MKILLLFFLLTVPVYAQQPLIVKKVNTAFSHDCDNGWKPVTKIINNKTGMVWCVEVKK